MSLPLSRIRFTALRVFFLAALMAPLLLFVNPSTDAAATTSVGGRFVSLSGGRLLDTRAATSVGGYSTPMQGTVWRTMQMTGRAGIPTAGVSAVAVSILTLNPAHAGYVNARPSGAPGTWEAVHHNYALGTNESNSTILTPNASGAVDLKTSSSVDVVVDVLGYFTTGAVGGAGFTSVSGVRMADSRDGTGWAAGLLQGGQSRSVSAIALPGIPDNVSAVAVNVTVSGQSNAGYLRAFASGTAPPELRNYFRSGYAESFGTTIPVGTDGKISVGVWGASSHVIVDLVGYFVSGDEDGIYHAYSSRVLDSRLENGTGWLSAGSRRAVQVTAIDGLPGTGVSAAQLHVAAVNASASGYLKIWPVEEPEPTTSALSYQSGAPTSNSVVARLRHSGAVYVKNYGSQPIQLVIDSHGYFASSTSQATPDVHSVTIQDQRGPVLELEFDSPVSRAVVEDSLDQITSGVRSEVADGQMVISEDVSEPIPTVQHDPTIPDDAEFDPSESTALETVALGDAAKHGQGSYLNADRTLRQPEPSAKRIYCNESYTFPDSKGVFTIQRACRYKRAPWSFRISPEIRAIINTFVDERGMWYTINGGTLNKMYDHPATLSSYIFHGFFRAARNDRISWSDRFTFRHNVGPGGRGTLNISGTHLHLGPLR